MVTSQLDKRKRILYVDDEEPNLLLFEASFHHHFEVFLASSGEEALDILEKAQDIDMIITDHKMPNMSGLQLLKHTATDYPEIPRIILSGCIDFEEIKEALNEIGINKYISKPWNTDQLKQLLEEELEVV